MKILKDKVVSLHYTLRNDGGDTIDSSGSGEPLAYIQGGGSILPALETALEGREVGEKFDIRLAAKDGYGEHRAELVQVIPRKALATIGKIKVGTQFHAQAPGGARVMTITAVEKENVTVDGNHPLAGVDLNFSIEIVGVRDASAEELAHGHVHGEGGHH
ncbi:MAG TPA: peptidylprolyl isomerase [Steroidobacteraceae bacterium]|nr:peptidylprolyl isomerase [Steroidobacteraceae bacterium]